MSNQFESYGALYAQARDDLEAALAGPVRGEIEQLYASILGESPGALSFIDVSRYSQERLGVALTNLLLGLLQLPREQLSPCLETIGASHGLDAVSRNWLETLYHRFGFLVRRAVEVSHRPMRWRLLITNFGFFDLQRQLRAETSIVRSDGEAFHFQSIGEDFVFLFRHWAEKLVEISQHPDGQRFIRQHADALTAIREMVNHVLSTLPAQDSNGHDQ